VLIAEGYTALKKGIRKAIVDARDNALDETNKTKEWKPAKVTPEARQQILDMVRGGCEIREAIRLVTGYTSRGALHYVLEDREIFVAVQEQHRKERLEMLSEAAYVARQLSERLKNEAPTSRPDHVRSLATAAAIMMDKAKDLAGLTEPAVQVNLANITLDNNSLQHLAKAALRFLAVAGHGDSGQTGGEGG
jgi:hypothetical protein